MIQGLFLTILYHTLKVRKRCLSNHCTLTQPALAEASCVAYEDMSHEIVVYIVQDYLVLLLVALRVATASALKPCQ